MTRPSLTADLTGKEFREYYFLKEEIKDFCRANGLKVSGSKNDLEKRICHFLDTGKVLNESKPDYVKAEDSGEITLDSKIGTNFRCSEDKRKFFENEIGKVLVSYKLCKSTEIKGLIKKSISFCKCEF